MIRRAINASSRHSVQYHVHESNGLDSGNFSKMDLKFRLSQFSCCSSDPFGVSTQIWFCVKACLHYWNCFCLLTPYFSDTPAHAFVCFQIFCLVLFCLDCLA